MDGLMERCFEALVGDSSIQRVLDDEVDALHFAQNVLGLAEAEEVSEELVLVGGQRVLLASIQSLRIAWTSVASITPGSDLGRNRERELEVRPR